MDTVRQGIRAGSVERGRFDRLRCTDCETDLVLADDADVVGTVMACPDCGTEWVEF